MISFKLTYPLLLVIAFGSLQGCNREYLLNETQSSVMTVPSTLESLQSLLDKDAIMKETPVLGELSADNFYLSTSYWQSLPEAEHNAYTWEADIFGSQASSNDWNLPYRQVFYANVVLDGLGNIPVNNQNRIQWNAIKGSALFIRAYAFYNLSQVFAPVYENKSADVEAGIPLRLSSGIDDVSTRASLRQTYDRILQDLSEATTLLPATVDSLYRNRPSRPACMAMLARAYLSMREYTLAGAYADSSLLLYGKLMDYNKIDTGATYSFSKLNDETLYQSWLLSSSTVLIKNPVSDCSIDSVLYRSYAVSDLRRQLFYTVNPSGRITIRNNYTGAVFPFSGLATDEMYLIRAECQARAKNTQASMNDLNSLLQNRYKTGSFVPLTAVSAEEALEKVLIERRKELPFRGLRWTDIRRLNKENAGITLDRFINNQHYRLLPNDRRYVLPIPPNVIAQSGMIQNQR